MNKTFDLPKTFVLLQRVSLVRPAPAELPQDGNVARVSGCSGAIQVAYPFFMPKHFVSKFILKYKAF